MFALVGLVVAALGAIADMGAAQPPAPPRQNAFAPDGTPIALGLAGYAKVLCSAVFVSGREPAEAFENSGFFLFPASERRGITYDVDRGKQLVRMTHGTVTRTAKLYGDQGLHHPPTGARRRFLHARTREDEAA